MSFLEHYEPVFEEMETRHSNKHQEDIILEDDEIESYRRRIQQLEEEIRSTEDILETGNPLVFFEPQPNFPKFYPIIYFQLEDVPEIHRHYVQDSIFCWISLFLTLFLNWISSLFLLSTKNTVTSPGSKIALATLYLIVISPITLDLYVLDVFKAFQTDISTLKFLKILISIAAFFIFFFFLAIGSESSGGMGIISTINLFVGHYNSVGFLGVLCSIALVFCCVVHSKCFLKLWKFYRGTEQGENLEGTLTRTVSGFIVDRLAAH